MSLFIPVFYVVSVIAGYVLINLPIGFTENALIARIIGSVIGLAVAIALGWFCGKLLEGLPFRSLGVWFTKFWLKDFSLGFLFGGISVAIAAAIGVLFGDLSFKFNDAGGVTAIGITLGMAFVVFFFGAAFEEVLVRGYIFQTFTRAKLAWLAILITSLFFAAGHLANPASNWVSSLNTGLAGGWLGIAYLKTRTLWLAFGVHFGWNWVMGALFGIEVSGLTALTPSPLFIEVDSGPVWVTGGDYGLEGGIACTVALVVSAAAIWFLPVFKPTEEMLELSGSEKPNDKFLEKYGVPTIEA